MVGVFFWKAQFTEICSSVKIFSGKLTKSLPLLANCPTLEHVSIFPVNIYWVWVSDNLVFIIKVRQNGGADINIYSAYSCHAKSYLRQPGVWGLEHPHQSETPVSLDRPGIKVSLTLGLKSRAAVLKLDQLTKGWYQCLQLEDVFKLICTTGFQWLN